MYRLRIPQAVEKLMTQRLSYSGTFVFILAVSLLLSGGYLIAAEAVAGSGPARFRVFTLKHIPAEQGMKYLAEAEIGTVSRLPSVNTLLVTASQLDLIKATAILRLVDSEQKFVIKKILLLP